MSPLHVAAKYELSLFKEIAPKFEDKNPANSEGDTPIHVAIKNGNLNVCKYIIENVDKKRINSPNKFGFTPLHYCAIMSNFEIYKLICENIEDKHPEDKIGITPLQIAISGSDGLEISEYASKEKIIRKEDIHIVAIEKIQIITILTLKEVLQSKECLVKFLEEKMLDKDFTCDSCSSCQEYDKI